MAPSSSLVGVDKRYPYCPSGTYYSGGACYRNPGGWYYWGRWVLAGVIIVAAIALLVLVGCINSRRRRKRGLAPRYGTGWMAPANKYGNNPGGYAPPPPQYSATPMQNYPPQQPPQYTGQTFNSNEGYYGNHTEGVAPPPNAYYPSQRGGANVYEPPPGPPPGK